MKDGVGRVSWVSLEGSELARRVRTMDPNRGPKGAARVSERLKEKDGADIDYDNGSIDSKIRGILDIIIYQIPVSFILV